MLDERLMKYQPLIMSAYIDSYTHKFGLNITLKPTTLAISLITVTLTMESLIKNHSKAYVDYMASTVSMAYKIYYNPLTVLEAITLAQIYVISECIYSQKIVEYSLCIVDGSSTFCNTTARRKSPFS